MTSSNTTARDLLAKIQNVPSGKVYSSSYPSFLQRGPRTLRGRTRSAPATTDPILDRTWVDDNVFWAHQYRPYLQDDTRAMAQVALSQVMTDANSTAAASAAFELSSASPQLLGILRGDIEMPVLDAVAARPPIPTAAAAVPMTRSPSRTDTRVTSSTSSFRFTTSASSNISQTSYTSEGESVKSDAAEKDMRRQSLLMSLLPSEQPNPDTAPALPILAPRPCKPTTIPFIHRPLKPSYIITNPRPSITRPSTPFENAFGGEFFSALDEAGFDGDDEFDDSESSLDEGVDMIIDDEDDGPWEDIELTPRTCGFISMPGPAFPISMPPTPALQNVPLPAISPVSGMPIYDAWWNEVSSDARSDVTSVDYPPELLSPLDHLMRGDAQIRAGTLVFTVY
ncbi:hypothetical protein EIP91_002726 [Steccherinum ochraceum]|uniref:Uncharacterized protein n=1 Tax=Steccherinum ochraceum TaxID=92696 RepID=A0A4R0RDG2_9APHY|nr:hypothetical protein EIP91_002726 [Steccherinum ochraceum]